MTSHDYYTGNIKNSKKYSIGKEFSLKIKNKVNENSTYFKLLHFFIVPSTSAKNVWKALKTKSLKSSIFNEIITNVENVTTNFFEFFSSEFYELYDLIHKLLFLTTIFNYFLELSVM